ncbi:peptidylprolyl isomerase [Croceicoccus mobilis]|uniref:Peptidyl-prolyl cis-trans isomerase n=1 Tax=Croceicoccus mobilis TaxID=1703339 RepID=A0A916YZ87_9SPHN|nr:peptidylprolyl isomerase [Croceicoccus mobilis]GGD68394.1 peptidyl-prolyl cis-trans isomerase [Croceicoccus mobilis]
MNTTAKLLSRAACIAALALAPAPLALAQEESEFPPTSAAIVKAAPDSAWQEIPAEDLLVMTLAPDSSGNPRRVVIQLIDAPISEKWVANIRTMARAHWWDGLSIYRSVDNWVVQWGDGEEDEGDRTRPARPLPDGIVPTAEEDYTIAWQPGLTGTLWGADGRRAAEAAVNPRQDKMAAKGPDFSDPYAEAFGYLRGLPIAAELQNHVVTDGTGMSNRPAKVWPVHCYASVGVARDLSPDAGTGAELYAVIGHAPRALDRNIAVVGKVIDGIEHMSILPRGTAAFGVYETEAEHTPIISVRLASELPDTERPRFRFLDTESESFAAYADRTANRYDPFYRVPAGGADVCNVRVPLREIED